MESNELISQAMSTIAKEAHKRNPRSKEFYQYMAKLSHKKKPRSKSYYKKIQKLSTLAKAKKKEDLQEG